MKLSEAWRDQPIDRAGPNTTTRLDEIRAKVECWSMCAVILTHTNLSHQDPLFHRHQSHPTANRTPLLVALYDQAEDTVGPILIAPDPHGGNQSENIR